MKRRRSVKLREIGKTALLCACAALVALAPAKARALDLADQKIEIHGYGDEGYLLTNANKFLGTDTHGTWNFNHLALLFSATVTDNVTIWTQLFAESEADSMVRLDWAYVDYKFNNDLSARAGQIKLPMGIYNEIRDIRYLQLSSVEPSMYQDGPDIIDESFRGVGARYDKEFDGSALALDLYGGQPVSFAGDEQKLNNMIGGRISYHPPVEGLKVMGSAATSKAEVDGGKGQKTTYVGSLDYVARNVDFKAEYAWMKIIGTTRYSYYAQAGYTFFDKLTPFVRYDYITTDKDQKSDPAFHQKDLTVGVGYKINANFAVKAEDHFITGYALPVATGEVTAGEGKANWNLFAASINFMF